MTRFDAVQYLAHGIKKSQSFSSISSSDNFSNYENEIKFIGPSSSLIKDPSKYHLNAIDPPDTLSKSKLVSGNVAVAIPVNVATPITFDTLWGV